MKKAIITKRIVSIFLSSITAFMLPSQAFATNLSDKNIKYSSFDDIQGNGEKVANIVMELEEERTENTKLFLLDDGSKMLAEYTEPIHYKNDNNEWAEYNNTLVAENALYSADYDTDYTNKSSNLNIKLSKKAKPQNMINISDDEYSISWGYENTNKSNIIINNSDVDLNENDKFTSVKNITSKVSYENVYKNVDLQYFVTTTGVKENIILKDSDVQNEFYISYKTKKLTAKQTDDYTITLYNKDNTPVYMINAPYMVDEKGEASSQLKLEILSQNGVNLNIKLTADYDYVHSSNRSYPITIDPELTNKFSSELYLNEVYGNSTLNHGPYYISNDHYIVAKLLKLPELDEGEKIISAKYNFEIKNGSSLFANETDSPIIINAHKLNGIENGVVSYESDILDYDSLSYNDNSKFTFDLTKLTKEWYDNGDKVDGFVIEGLDTAESRIANLKESTRTSATPSITIIYKDYSGTESNLSYHTVSAGYNAQAKVSDYLGNLVVSQKLYEGTGARMPVTISATYNSIKNNDISGCGWYFSFEQCIKETNKNLSNAGYNYIYIDTEGTSHYLKKSSSEEKWLGEDGLGITLSVKEDCIIVENGNTTQTFDTVANGGKILSETDKNGNTVTYSYTNGYLSSITDGSGRIIQLRYTGKPDGSKRINQVTLPDNEKISIYYNSSEIDTISAFVFPDKKTSAFYYDKNNKITKEQLQNRTLENTAVISKHCFIYNEKGQVTKITEYGKNNSEGNYLNITYSNDNTTVFEDRNGLKTTYTFDNKGVLMSVLNANGYLESNHSSGLQNTSGADSFTKNILAESYEFSTIGTNKYYTKSNGKINGVQSKDGICEIDSSKPSKEDGTFQYFGSNSIKISNPVSENNASFYTSAFHDISITDENYIGKELTLSAYVKTKNVKWKTLDEAFGALLEVEFYDFFANLLDSKTSIGISETEDWQRISVTVTVPESTRTMRIKCSVKNTTGTAWFDCLQLEEGNCANDFNALQNSDFESNDYWFTNDKKSISTKEGVVSLGGKEGVDLQRGADTQTALKAGGIVVGDISSDHVRQGLPAGEPPAIVAFPLEDAPETLHGAVVDAFAHPGHTLSHPGGSQLVMEDLCGVLEPPVAVEEGMGAGVFGNGPVQGIVNQGSVVGIPEGESHDPPVTQVQDGAQVEFPHRGTRMVVEFCHISEPFLVGPVRMEVPVQQVLRCVLGCTAPLGTALSDVLYRRADVQAPADTQGALVIDGCLMVARQVIPDAAVALVRALSVDLLHQAGDPLVFLRPRTQLARAPPVVPGPGDPQRPARRLHRTAGCLYTPPDGFVLPHLPKLPQASPLPSSSNFFRRYSSSLSSSFSSCSRAFSIRRASSLSRGVCLASRFPLRSSSPANPCAWYFFTQPRTSWAGSS